MEDEVNPLERDYSLTVVLPGGLERNTMVHGSKPVMDLLVTLCARYHLNPSDHTVEVLSANKNIISFKPNSAIGSLEAEKILLKPKGIEEKPKRTYMPEASVRLLINYRKSHKAVVRVNPRVPLGQLLPAVCRKCELKAETTVLLRDSRAQQPLDLTMSLNEHGLRELFAEERAAVAATEVTSQSAAQDLVQNKALPNNKIKEKENKGFLSLFRRTKTNSEMECVSVPTSGKQHQQQLCASVGSLGLRSPNMLPADMPKKKKRAPPPPPPAASPCRPDNLGTRHLITQGSAESTLMRTKRRAPPPPPLPPPPPPAASPHPEVPPDTDVPGTVDSPDTCEELAEVHESECVNPSPPPSPQPSPHLFSTLPTPSRDGKKPCLPRTLNTGKELPQAHSALAQILTTSVYSGKLATRLQNSDVFSKPRGGPYAASLAQKRTDDDGSFACPEDYACNLSHDVDWDDPMQRKGLTTFKVVPSAPQRSYEVEVTLEVPVPCRGSQDHHPVSEPEDDQTAESPSSPERPDYEIAAPESEISPAETRVPNGNASLLSSPEVSGYQDDVPASRGPPQRSQLGEAEEEPGRPEEVDLAAVTAQVPPEDCAAGDNTTDEGGLKAGVESPTPQSPSGPMINPEVPQPTSAFHEEGVVVGEEEEEEEEEECGLPDEGEDRFPPPPPPVFFNEELEEADEARGPQSPAVSAGTCMEGPASPSSPVAGPTLLKRVSAVPSRFAQAVALAIQKGRADVRGRGLHPHVNGEPRHLFSAASPMPDWLPHTSLNGSSCLG